MITSTLLLGPVKRRNFIGDRTRSLCGISAASGFLMPYYLLFPIEGYFFFTARLTFDFSSDVPNRETRAKAFRACASFSIGYFRLSGSAKEVAGSSFRVRVESFAICNLILDVVSR